MPTATTTTTRHSLPVTLNIECDRLASQTTLTALGDCRTDLRALEPPYEGSRAMLRIGHRWITSHHASHILRARWTPSIIIYCKEKYGWDADTIHDISWHSIGRARKRCTPTQLMQTSKIMHAWLPTMHMQGRDHGSPNCPNCPHQDETMDHLFHCPHPVLKSKREMILEQLCKKGLSLGLPRAVLDGLFSLLTAYLNNTPSIRPVDPGIERAWAAQYRIGISMLPRGFVSSQWILALEELGCPHPHRKLASMVYHLLLDFTNKIWRERSSLAHESTNLNDLAQESAIDQHLCWYRLNYITVLSHHDFHLIDGIHADKLISASLRTKRQWLVHLDAARDVYAVECAVRERGQTCITDYFRPKSGISDHE